MSPTTLIAEVCWPTFEHVHISAPREENVVMPRREHLGCGVGYVRHPKGVRNGGMTFE